MHLRKILTFTCLLVLVVSCGKREEATTKQILRLNIHTEPPTLDSRKATDTTSRFVIKQFRIGLMRRGRTGEPEFDLAKGVDISEDGLTYTFHLREAYWSNGAPITAHDFERTWKTIISPTFPSEHAYELYKIKNGKKIKEQGASVNELGVKALDHVTLQVDLEHPVPYFLSLVATHPFFPSLETFDQTISSGPFRLVKWRHFDELVLEKNPYYWDQSQVKLDKLHLFIIEDDHTELNLFENGEIDWAGHPFTNLPTDSLSELSKRETIYRQPLDAVYYYIFNTKEYPFGNANFRRALSFAINRKEIVENITQMGQQPSYFLVPDSMWAKGMAPTSLQDDPSKAKYYFELALHELGTTVDKLPPITLSYNTMVGHHKTAQAIQQQWNKVFGLKVKLENKDWKVFLDHVHSGQFQIARAGGVAGINDPITFLEDFRYPNAGTNSSSWSSDKYQELITTAELTNDPLKRLMLLKEAESLLIHEMPIAPIYIYTSSYVKKNYVKNVYVSSLGDMDLKYAYIEHDKKTSP